MRVETVAREISEALQKNAVYLISDADLRQLWPDLQQRYTQVKEFAAALGWWLFAYGVGGGEMFIRKGKATPDVRSKVDLDWWCGTAQPIASSVSQTQLRDSRRMAGR